MKKQIKKTLSLCLAVLMLMSCWVWVAPEAEAASSVSYPLTLNFKNSADLKGGHVLVKYYEVNADGSVNTGTSHDHYMTESFGTDGKAGSGSQTISTTCPGWPYSLTISVSASGGNVYMSSFYVGTKNVLNSWEGTTTAGNSRTWETGGVYDSISMDWDQPYIASTGTAPGSASLTVPYAGTKSASFTAASFKDQYGQTWPGSISYSLKTTTGSAAATGVSLNGTTITVNSSASALFDSAYGYTAANGYTNLTLTASCGQYTATNTVKLYAPPKEILYENLFSISDWFYTDSSAATNGTTSVDLSAGTITLTKSSSSYAKTGYTTGSSYYYTMPVTAGKTYTAEYKTTASVNTQVNYYFLNSSRSELSSYTLGGSTGTNWKKTDMVAPSGATALQIQFTAFDTATFKDIAVYETDRATEIGLDSWSGREYRKAYKFGEAIGSTFATPSRAGYNFEGWEIDKHDGNGQQAINSADTVKGPYTLYSSWSKKALDIGYENIFSLSDWSESSCVNVNNSDYGSVSYDVAAGTITATDNSSYTTSNDLYTNYGIGDEFYKMPVAANTEYTLAYDVSSTGGQCFVFFYTDTGVCSTAHMQMSAATGAHTFTTPAGCTQLGIRFGTSTNGASVVFSNIGIYESSDYALADELNYPTRLYFVVGDTTALSTPSREGYKFNGWFTADGTKLTSVAGLTESTVVYAEWVKTYSITFLDGDGNIIKTVTVNEGASVASSDVPAASAVEKSPDASGSYTWDGTWSGGSYTNVTADATLTPNFTVTAHTNIDYIKEASAATCTDPAYWYMSCNDCGYDFGGEAQPYGDALGHEFDKADGATVVTGSSSGNGDNDTHSIKCARCTEVKAAAETHTFNTVSTSGADCITEGTVHQKCACGQERDISGAKDPNTHSNTETIGAKAATCTEDGYTGDLYCRDCNTTVTYGSTIGKLGHSFTKYQSNGDATCTEDGTKTAKCDRCDVTDTQPDADSATGHTWIDEGTDLYSAADCENDAVYYQTCDVCGISAKGEATGGTWTDVGSKWNHNFTGDYVSNNDGTHERKCVNENCGATGANEGCTYGPWTTGDASTHSHTCVHCSYTPEATEHEWTDWEEVADNTDSAPGKMTHKCTVCTREETTECQYDSVYVSETCTTAAYTTYTCKDCGHGYTVIGKAATGHDYTGDYVYDADADKHQRLCVNGCDTYGIGATEGEWEACEFEYTNKEAGKHTAECKYCENSEVQDCTGGNATCTAPAVCDLCHTEYGTTTAHEYTCTDEYKYLAQAATCITNELYYKYCEGCGATDYSATYEKPDSMAPHDYSCTDEYRYLATEATCIDNETYYVYCSNTACKKSSQGTDEEDTFEKDGTALNHKWDYSVATQSATAGYHYYDCTRCDATKEEACACAMPAVAPQTCIDEGYTLYICDECSYQWIPDESRTPALGHDYTKQNPVAAYFREDADCETAKTYWYQCSRCPASAEDAENEADRVYYTNGKALGHTWDNVADETYIYKVATCTAAAKYYASCTVCKKSSAGTSEEAIFSYGAALGHDYQNNVIEANKVSDATCTDAAVYYKSCSRINEGELCGHVSTETFSHGDKLGHSMTHVEAVPAECLKDGVIEHWICGTCGKYFLDEEGNTETTAKKVIDEATGHDYEKIPALDPDCEEPGYSSYEKCKNCGTEKGKTDYPATGHDFTGALVCHEDTDYHSKACVNANCTESGWNGVKYEVAEDGTIVGGVACDYTKETISSTEDDGSKHYHTSICICGNEKTEEITAITVTTEKVTCTTDGYTLHVCDVCGDEWKTNIVAHEGHKYDGVSATQNADGKTHSVRCSVCGEAKSAEPCYGGTATCKAKAVCEVCNSEYGTIVDHDIPDDKWVYQNDATCRANGTEKNACTVCGHEVTREKENSMIPHKMTDFIFDVSGWNGMPADFDKDSIKEATCKTEGLSISYCQYEGCDYHKTNIVKADATQHMWKTDANGEIEWTVLSGDCGTGLTLQSICTVCGETKTKREEGEHEWVETKFIEPLCTKNGYREYKCAVCEFTKEEYYNPETGEPADLAATGIHKYSKATEVEATCTRNAYTVETCIICRYERITEIEGTMLDHELYEVKAVEATCEKDGHSAYQKCVDCAYETGKEVYTKTGHADTNDDGKCDNCNGAMYDSDDGNGACNCICHKNNWLMRIIYKILNFFWKLFKISKSCNCGYVHW